MHPIFKNLKRKSTVLFASALSIIVCTRCATYTYADSIKTISLSGDLRKGISIGNIRGEDCTWQILGYKFDGDPSIVRAISSAVFQPENETDGEEKTATPVVAKIKILRYINRVHTQSRGFDGAVLAKNCIVVTGEGYK